jgi:hypothetical protein
MARGHQLTRMKCQSIYRATVGDAAGASFALIGSPILLFFSQSRRLNDPRTIVQYRDCLIRIILREWESHGEGVQNFCFPPSREVPSARKRVPRATNYD